MRLFAHHDDYSAFERIIAETLTELPMRLCGYCVMPNHWHFVLWPEGDDDLSKFVQRLTLTHAARWRKHRGTVGDGHVYQGRFKSFPIENDEHFYSVIRYVERNALRANLVRRAEEWRWSSCWIRTHGTPTEQKMLSCWPLPIPSDWTTLVNQVQSDAELRALRNCAERGQPYGSESWVRQTASELGTLSAMRPRGRPRREGLF